MILLTGGSGFLGTAFRRVFNGNLTAPSSAELDLMDSSAVETYFDANEPEIVVHLAARVGGIKANISNPARFLIENVQMDSNVMAAVLRHKPAHTVFMLSTCMYPDRLEDSEYPLFESRIEDGPPPPTNASYAAAKRTLLHGAAALHAESSIEFSALIPSNLYGPADHFGSEASHFLAAAVTRIEEARRRGLGEVEFFGTGRALRQFLFIDDLAAILAHLVETGPLNEAVNVAPTHNLSIRELAEAVADAAEYGGRVTFSGEGPDGQYRKDVSTKRLRELIPSWPQLETPLELGLKQTISWYRSHVETG